MIFNAVQLSVLKCHISSPGGAVVHGRRGALHHLRQLPGQLLRAPPLLPLLPSLHRPRPRQLPHHHWRPPHPQLPSGSLYSEQVDGDLVTAIFISFKEYYWWSSVTFTRIPVEGHFAEQKISKPAEVKITFWHLTSMRVLSLTLF